MGIWCQTSKPFYSLREPPGQNIELGSQLRFCPSLSQWLGLSAVFIPRISYSTLNETEIVRCCQLYLNL